MATFLPMFFTVALISLVLSFLVMLLFATLDGITIPRIKARYQHFMAKSAGEKIRLAYHVPFAILFGGLFALMMIALVPVIGHPAVVIPVVVITTGMVTLTLAGS